MNQIVESETEKKTLLDEVVRFQPALGMSAIGWMEVFTELLIKMPTAWFVVKEPLREEYVDSWIQKYGEWAHGSGNTKSHNRLGMAYAWWALHKVNGLDEINLSDSPDFSGRMPLREDTHGSLTMVRVYGDIGKCGPVALFDSLMALNFHDVWISVVDWETQIFIRFGYSPARYNQLKFWSKLKTVDDYPRAIQEIFFCEGCNEWSITEESRKMLIEWYQCQ